MSPDRRSETIENYFKQCDTGNVRIVVMDLSKAFKEAVRRQLGDPIIIADRYHFIRQVYWAFDRVRREVQHELYSEQRIRLKRNKEILWKSPFNLNEEGRER
ncbi:transposase, partial [Pseudomonas sp. 2822-15]|uniref:transposase n=1 Tax=Pseudomonas sp. 2822-15 TaxID=1712677 RepID=UPI0035321A67